METMDFWWSESTGCFLYCATDGHGEAERNRSSTTLSGFGSEFPRKIGSESEFGMYGIVYIKCKVHWFMQ